MVLGLPINQQQEQNQYTKLTSSKFTVKLLTFSSPIYKWSRIPEIAFSKTSSVENALKFQHGGKRKFVAEYEATFFKQDNESLQFQ